VRLQGYNLRSFVETIKKRFRGCIGKAALANERGSLRATKARCVTEDTLGCGSLPGEEDFEVAFANLMSHSGLLKFTM